MYKFFMALFLLYVPASMSALHGCVILKFVGDGLLAIFPVTNPVEAARAAGNALAAAQEAQAALGVLRARPRRANRRSKSSSLFTMAPSSKAASERPTASTSW
jgi:hypothetical protein